MSKPRLCPRHPIDSPRCAVPAAILCRSCIDCTDRDLYRLPALYRQLATVAAPSGQQLGGARNADTPIPYRENAANQRKQIRDILTSWTRLVAEERGVNVPGLAPLADPVQTLARFLRRHHPWSVARPWAGDYADEVTALTSEGHRICYPSRARRVTCGQCIEVVSGRRCEGTLTAVVRQTDDLLPSEIVCDACGQEVISNQWIKYGQRVIDRQAS